MVGVGTSFTVGNEGFGSMDGVDTLGAVGNGKGFNIMDGGDTLGAGTLALGAIGNGGFGTMAGGSAVGGVGCESMVCGDVCEYVGVDDRGVGNRDTSHDSTKVLAPLLLGQEVSHKGIFRFCFFIFHSSFKDSICRTGFMYPALTS